MTTIFNIGDNIKKVEDEKIYKIIDLKEVKGGNWHDGFSVTFVATIETTLNSDIKPETEPEEYCIQYINYMCQINNVYATKITQNDC
jgi:hypothetical protein